MVLGRAMLLWLLFIGSVFCTPTDEFKEHTENLAGDYSNKQNKILRNIVPGGLTAPDRHTLTATRDDARLTWPELMMLDPNNKHFTLVQKQIEKGAMLKGLTFNIYDDNLREAAVALYRLFESTDGEVFKKVRDWAKNNVNSEMYMYALRLESLYSSKTNESLLYPPFIWNPYYFVNSEALNKASVIANDITSYGTIDQQSARINQYNYGSTMMKASVVINTNYSMWNLPTDAQDNLNYFREDVGLNSHYLGIHLMHPFWMSNEELASNNPRFAEHYYYAHQQLMVRYNLEQLHLTDHEYKSNSSEDYVPYLKYKNGLLFPTRSCIRSVWNEQKAHLKNVDIGIRECISRGLLIMENGTMLSMTEDSHIDILSKLIRANLDGIKVAKIARAVFGYGGRKYPIDGYNPAPSVLHHPETSLRDPAYWLMIQHVLNYFSDFKENMQPYDLSQYECDDFEITENDFSKITTFFDYFVFSVNHATSNTHKDVTDWPAYLSVRQKRLANSPFRLNFTVISANAKDTIVRLFLGPECVDDCWYEYDNFFEMDTFKFALQEGVNIISWYPEMSDRLSFTDDYNTLIPRPGYPRYSIFQYPANLLIPRGLQEGLNLTLFIMITPADEDTQPDSPTTYRKFSKELDSKPLGFPFHRKAKLFKNFANNYKFYNLSIYHNSNDHFEYKGFFSPNLS